jgi:hypothetical protein
LYVFDHDAVLLDVAVQSSRSADQNVQGGADVAEFGKTLLHAGAADEAACAQGRLEVGCHRDDDLVDLVG